MRAGLTVLMTLLLSLVSAAAGAASAWEDFATPSGHEPTPVGSYSNGCLLGGSELPAEGSGYQVIRLSRMRNFGHPKLVDYLADLGERVERAGLGIMLVGDVAMPRGGPFSRGHRSHQTGLDADIWFRLDLPLLPREKREDLDAHIMIDRKSLTIGRNWTPKHAELIKLAAQDPRVSRIFVHPVIKKALCEQAGDDRSWLRTIRPWYKHDAHFHVRLHCPDSAAQCQPQAPPPPGDGCGPELTSWIEDLRHPKPAPPQPPKARPPLPVTCQALLENTTRPAIGMN